MVPDPGIVEAVAEDVGVMDEEILRAVLRRDESEAFLVVEPLHSSLGTHQCAPWMCKSAPRDTYCRLLDMRGTFRAVRDRRGHKKKAFNDNTLAPRGCDVKADRK